ncbi:MAG: lipoyl(octanoyl) transferase LipB [Candidatus Hydrothermia bacterium]|nr:lipoyl(octanoyl) transferase LipB [Candidatus Hydrothermia bacterium]
MDAILIKSGIVNYKEALEIQKIIHNLRKNEEIPNTLWLLEHEPVITFGRRGKLENLIVPENYLKEVGINIYYVERGGDVTYHGPGQLIGYLFFRINGLSEIRNFVRNLEKAIILGLKELNINAKQIENYTGVWVGNNKICAIGIAVKDWITFHGFALYIDPIYEHFNLIVPCGIKDKGITSIYKEVGIKERKLVENSIISGFERVFNLKFKEIELSEILKKEVEVYGNKGA